MSAHVEASYAHCQQVSRRAAKNFFYSFLVLPRSKRRAMYALYAFLRHTDDLGDSPQPADVRREALRRWRASLTAAFDGRFDAPLLPALADTVARYAIPHRYLHEAIDGVEMDLVERQYESFDDLRAYCYRVASVVGLACIHIWGFSSPQALEPACDCGLALQLTNILRDLREDALRGRIYLPAEDLRRFDYSAHDLLRGVRDERFRSLMRAQIARAEGFYRQGVELERFLSRDSRPAFNAMVGIYRGLLDEIKRRDGDVFSSRVRLSGWRKARIAAGSLLGRSAWRRRPWATGAETR